ncbi:MAG: hypothetical protein JWN38_1009 [Candidatus Saccharibacteria bacterium]|nr:hypothetical protein [Candidatus Saccharibacteria bacterium]
MINLFGPPTAGKSTIANLLREHIERLYTVDFDVVKHQISGYDWRRDSNISQDITIATLNSVAKAGLSIIVLMPLPRQQDAYERIAAAAVEHDYELFNVEITAPEAVLASRYIQRLSNMTDLKEKALMKTPDEHMTYVRTPYYRPSDTVSFDSSTNSPNEILSGILKLIA